MTLSQLKPGDTARIVAIGGGRGLREKLHLRGLSEGKVVRVISDLGPVTIEVDRSVITLGRGMAQKVVITPVLAVERKLSEMDYDQKGVIVRIQGGLRQQIAGMGIREGKRIKMLTRQPIRGPVVVTVDRTTTSLGLGLADTIIVQVEE